MTHSIMEPLLGFVLGCVLTSGVWAIIQALSKNERRLAKQRHTAMQEIAAECAEIDGKISVTALKATSAVSVLTALAPRIEKVNKMLTINMPFFDVYFVKYIEALIARYEAVVLPVEQAAPAPEIKKSPAASIPENKDAAAAQIPVKQKNDAQPPVAPIEQPADAEATIPLEPQPKAEEIKPNKKPESKQHQPLGETDKIDKADEKKKPVLKEENAGVFEVSPTQDTKSQLRATDTVAFTNFKSPQTASESSDAEILLSGHKTEAPQVAATATAVKEAPEDFISSEDLIDKIDTFFGIKE